MRLLTTEQVAATLAVAPRTVRRLRDRGQLRAVRVGNRLVRFAAEGVQAFVERGRRREARNAAAREKRRRDRGDRTCALEGCGKTFALKRNDARYCSNACRQAAYRERAA
jgi:excisionase family DNA binding protein